MERSDSDLLQRLVVAVEGLLEVHRSMAEEPVRVEAEGGPPICPHCHKLNPEIELNSEFAGSGPFAEFGMLVVCRNCSKTFCALPDGWAVYKEKEEFMEQLEARSKLMKSIEEG